MWAFAGWCGTPYPGWFLGPRPKPDPEPWWFVKIASIIGGIAGGWMTTRIIGGETASMLALTSMVGAFVTGGFLGGVVGLVAGGRNAAGG